MDPFQQRAVGRPVSMDEAQALLAAAVGELQRDYPGLQPRTLDNLIWKRERDRSE